MGKRVISKCRPHFCGQEQPHLQGWEGVTQWSVVGKDAKLGYLPGSTATPRRPGSGCGQGRFCPALVSAPAAAVSVSVESGHSCPFFGGIVLGLL